MGNDHLWTTFDAGIELPRVGDVDVEAIADTRDGFCVILRSHSGHKVRIAFKQPLAYRNMDEGDRLRSLPMLKPTGDHLLMCFVEESEWLRWFHDESYDMHRSQDVRHYAILTPDDWIDVLSVTPPLVEVLSGAPQQEVDAG